MSNPFVRKITDQTGLELWYRDYKDPLTPFPGGHGFVGALGFDDKARPTCHYCGKAFDDLARHARQSHGLSASSYKDETGLLRKSALVSERLRVSRSTVARRNVAAGRGFTADDSARAREARRLLPPGDSGQMKAERQNLTGRCYDQALAVARSLASSGRIDLKTLGKKGIGPKTVERYFGTMANLRMMVGVTTRPLRRYSKAVLADGLRRLAVELGRTPTQSDRVRYGMPDSSTYIRHFGSVGAAYVAAGLDPNLPGAAGYRGALDVALLVAYATHGHAGRAAKQVGIGQDTAFRILGKYGCPKPLRPNDTTERRAWAADMARRLSGWPERKEGAA